MPMHEPAMRRSVVLLLNVAHTFDHLFLLIFATAVTAIAHDFGLARWEDLMPYGAGAFLMFGLGSLPAGKLGDQWGRRQTMLVFFFGMGLASLLVATTQGPWALAAALALLGTFSAIYHPVGIPMLVQRTSNPGAAIGINGFAGNLGIAAAAILTGMLVEAAGWRTAFAVPGLACIALGALFWKLAPPEREPPARRGQRVDVPLAPGELARVLAVLTVASAASGLIFNLTTNGNGQMLGERLAARVSEPATLGWLLGAVYAVASLAQVVVGRLIDRFPLKPLWLTVVALQVPMLAAAAAASGWWAWLALLGSMIFVFGSIPFTDATLVRFVDDRMRSRVAGMRLAVSLGISSAAVWALGPAVKAAGFGVLFVGMAGVALLGAGVVMLLPNERGRRVPPSARSAAPLADAEAAGD
ncbi:MAG: MFS transporter [Burkholderiales bacterium]|nr:MFS transporter [Burkholderiales bacterium]